MTLITLISLTFFFWVVVVSAWEADNPTHIEEYIHYVASKERIPVREALVIARCESGFNPNALNPNGEYSVGVFQINLKYHPLTLEEARNPFRNINYAMDLYLKEGWWPWKRCALMHGLIA